VPSKRITAALPMFHVKRGTLVVCEGRAGKVVAICGAEKIQVKIAGTNEIVWATVEQLQPYVSDKGEARTLISPGDANPELEARAERWCRELSRFPSSAPVPYALRLGVSERMNCSVRTVNRRWARYLEDSSPSAQLDCIRGNPPGSRLLRPEVEQIVERGIQDVYLLRERPSITALHEHIRCLCRSAGFKAPCKRTVRGRIRDTDPLRVAKKRLGSHEGEALQAPSIRGLVAKKPLDIVQIDHAVMDVMVVSPRSRLPIGRPWITIAIDVYSRCILGYYISLDDPNQTSVGLCLEHACFPKTSWLKGLGEQVDYPMFGIMGCVHWDNAKTFKAKAIRTQCERMGIRVHDRPVRKPHYGAYVERYIGNLMGKLHLLPGTTFSNPKDRGTYNSEARATLSIEELRQWTVQQIAGAYHNTPHRGLGQRTPTETWHEAWRRADGAVELPPVMVSRRDFVLGFLPYLDRHVQRDGVHMFGLRYWDAALTPFINDHRKYQIHYRQDDLSQVAMYVNGEYLDIPLLERTRPAFSLFELKAVRKDMAPIRSRRGEAEFFAALERMREIVDEASRTSKKARKAQSRRPLTRGSEATSKAPLLDYSESIVLLDDALADVS